MSFKLQRRDSEEPTDAKNTGTESQRDAKPQKTYSVTVYVCLLFAVVIVIILMSYFVQQRNNSKAIITLREQHDQVTSQAFDNIEKLQNKNMELLDENNDLKEKEENYKSQIELLETKAEEAQTQLDSLKKENEYLKKLLDLQTAIAKQDSEKAEKLYEELISEKNSLPKEGRDNLDSLETAYEELIKSKETEE